MKEDTKRIKALVREAYASNMDRVHLRDVDSDNYLTASLTERYGVITIQFGKAFTLRVEPEDALEIAESLLAMAKNAKIK